MFRLIDLPNEMLDCICSYLPPKDVLSFALCSQNTYAVSKSYLGMVKYLVPKEYEGDESVVTIVKRLANENIELLQEIHLAPKEIIATRVYYQLMEYREEFDHLFEIIDKIETILANSKTPIHQKKEIFGLLNQINYKKSDDILNNIEGLLPSICRRFFDIKETILLTKSSLKNDIQNLLGILDFDHDYDDSDSCREDLHQMIHDFLHVYRIFFPAEFEETYQVIFEEKLKKVPQYIDERKLPFKKMLNFDKIQNALYYSPFIGKSKLKSISKDILNIEELSFNFIEKSLRFSSPYTLTVEFYLNLLCLVVGKEDNFLDVFKWMNLCLDSSHVATSEIDDGVPPIDYFIEIISKRKEQDYLNCCREFFTKLINQGYPVNYLGNSGNRLLHRLLCSQFIDEDVKKSFTKLLIENGADIDIQNDNGETPRSMLIELAFQDLINE